jgi:UDP-N-acetyl-D-mannosaminuronic acid transferase (WecB/TagA/CpsF family)
MVLLWKLFTAEAVPRISGLEHMKRLLEHPSLREPNAAVWVVATKNSREKLRTYLGQVQRSARAAPADATVEDANSSAEPMIYVAPQYVHPVTDPYLLALISEKHPRHVVIAVGGGIQDKLGRYLLGSLDYRPAVHCIGAALGFLTGDQVRIPDWADRYYVGWLFRSAAQPAVFIPRFWSARRLPWLIWKYRKQLPPLMSE